MICITCNGPVEANGSCKACTTPEQPKPAPRRQTDEFDDDDAPPRGSKGLWGNRPLPSNLKGTTLIDVAYL